MPGKKPLIDISTRSWSRPLSQPAYRRCHRCRGSGQAPCASCGGAGKMLLGSDSFGKPKYGSCPGCSGLKTRRCSHCAGTGLLDTDDRPVSRINSRVRSRVR